MSGLTPTEELIAIAKDEYNLSYGLEFELPDDIEHSVRVVGGIKLREFTEVPAGLLILRTLIVRAQSSMQDAQQDAMLEYATELLEEFPDLVSDFNEAYQALQSMPDAATNNSAFVLKYRKIRKAMGQLVESQVDDMRRISDLAFCFFLDKVCKDRSGWELKDLYALGKGSREELSVFMSKMIGLEPDTTDEDSDELTGESDKLVAEGKSTEGKTS